MTPPHAATQSVAYGMLQSYLYADHSDPDDVKAVATYNAAMADLDRVMRPFTLSWPWPEDLL